MKITKYTQSCMVLEKDGVSILIDPGNVYANKHDLNELGKIDAVIYTHRHADHFDESMYQLIVQKGIKCYSNPDVSEIAPEVAVVNDGDEFSIGSFNIKAIDLDHCLMPDGSSGPPNTGFVFDGSFFHPGDGAYLEGLSVDVLALPITGPDISMKDAFQFANQLGAKKVIAIHYDTLGAKAEFYKLFAERFGQSYEFIVLADGESTTL